MGFLPSIPVFTRVRRNYREILVCLAASSSALNAGFAISYSSIAIKELEQGIGSIHLTTDGATWFGSLLPLMAMCGSLLSGPLMDQFGRRPAILAVVVCFLISWIAMIFSSGYTMLFSGRGLSGLATGMCTAVIPVYVSEVSPASLRGAMGGVFSILLSAGIPIGYCCAISYHWRSVAEIGAGLASATFILCYVLPESPYWLVRQNRVSDAMRCIKTLRGKNGDSSTEVKDIQCLQEELSQPVKLREIFSRTFLKPLFIGVCLMVFQQLSGVNAIFFYAHEIFHRANFHDEILASILVGTMQVVATMLATLVIDRAGRKNLLVISGICMMACHAVLGGCMFILSDEQRMNGTELVPLTSTPFLEPKFEGNSTANTSNNIFSEVSNNSSELHHIIHRDVGDNISANIKLEDEERTATLMSWIALILVMLYVTSYSIGLGPVPYIALSEMLPQRGRGVACGIGTMSNWICAFLLTKSFVGLVELITVGGMFWLFSSICLLSAIFVWRYVPETRGKTLMEIQYLFMKSGTAPQTKSPIRIIEQVAASPLLRSKRSDSLEEQTKTLVLEEC